MLRFFLMFVGCFEVGRNLLVCILSDPSKYCYIESSVSMMTTPKFLSAGFMVIICLDFWSLSMVFRWLLVRLLTLDSHIVGNALSNSSFVLYM